MELKNEVANVNGYKKYPDLVYCKTLDVLFCLCCNLFPTRTDQGQRTQKHITFT